VTNYITQQTEFLQLKHSAVADTPREKATSCPNLWWVVPVTSPLLKLFSSQTAVGLIKQFKQNRPHNYKRRRLLLFSTIVFF
jgi:hypothetical protein